MTVTFYWYPKCSTCRNAKKWLEAQEMEVKDVHIVERPPSVEELRTLWKNSGLELKKLFNVSGQKYRELGLKDTLPNMSEDEALSLLASDGMLIKRPLTTDGIKVTVGFKKEQFEEVWA